MHYMISVMCVVAASLADTPFVVDLILVWTGSSFAALGIIYMLKLSNRVKSEYILVRDGLMKKTVVTVVLLPFYVLSYLALMIKSLDSCGPISQITGNLFLGQQLLFFHKRIFKDNGIGAVLDVTAEQTEPSFVREANYLKIAVLDKTSPSMKQLIMGIEWGCGQLKLGRKLFVHCGAGHERSATFVAAILMAMGLAEDVSGAINLVAGKRPGSNPTKAQMDLLDQWSRRIGLT